MNLEDTFLPEYAERAIDERIAAEVEEPEWLVAGYETNTAWLRQQSKDFEAAIFWRDSALRGRDEYERKNWHL